jgi:MFS family permease
MPRVPRDAPVRVAAPIDAVRDAAVTRLDARVEPDGSLRLPSPAPDPDVAVVLDLVSEGETTIVFARQVGRLRLPFFGWFFRPLVAAAGRRGCRYAIETLRHVCEGAPEPPPPRGVLGLPDEPFSPEQATLLATAAAAVAVVAFGSALFGQLADPVQEAFDASDTKLGVALAITRAGALVALFVTAIADRRGRRRSILIGVVGSAVACAASAIAPTLELFTMAQIVQRGCVITTVTVAGIAAIEEAPEGSRAYAASMLALAGGFGFSFAVVFLPLADIGRHGWRLPYVIGAGTILLAPRIAPRLAETTRYRTLETRAEVTRGRVREIFDSHYGRRFALLAAVGFLTSVFNAPSSQLMNKYLSDERDFSNSGIAGFRAVTTALPGLIGLVVGGRLAESKGRKPVAIVALLIATVTQMVFFLHGGSILWVMAAASVLTSSMAGIALGTLDAELFPTEVRSTSNALLTVVGVVGSATGLILAGSLSDPTGGIGNSIALCGIASLLAAVFFLPRLPETGARLLDDVSPTETSAKPTEGEAERGVDQ